MQWKVLDKYILQALENRERSYHRWRTEEIKRWLIAASGIFIFIIGQTRTVFLGGTSQTW